MNALILLAIVLCVFVMGYRFYGRFLALGVFPPRTDAETPAHRHADNPDFGAVGRWQLLGFHSAASSGLLSITGVGIGVTWGWAPAFLWIVVGTLIAGGTYALASLWASLREDGNSLAGVIFGAAGAWAALPVFLLGAGLLVLACTLTLVLLGQLLQTHPEATWFFLALLGAAGMVRRMNSSAGIAGKLIWGAATAALLLTGLFLGQTIPLNLGGQLGLDIQGSSVLRIPSETPWIAVALVAAFRSADAPANLISVPRGSLVGFMVLLLMLLLATGLLLSPPNLVAPNFNSGETLPGVFPLLFLVITAGSISGVCALIVTGPTLRQVDRHADAPLITFGGAMINGALAVLVLVALCAGFSETTEWTSIYGSLPDQADVFAWLDLAITKSGRFVAALGIAMPVAVAIVASVVASMAISMLESALRALSFGVEEFAEDFGFERIKGRKQRTRIAAGGVALAAFCVLQTDLGLAHWLFLGLTNQLFAGTIMLLLGLILLRHARGAAFVLVPALFVLVCGFWGLSWLLSDWWQSEHRWLLGMAIVAGVLTTVSLAACVQGFVKSRQPGSATPPDSP